MFNVHVSHCTQTNMNYNEHVVVLGFFCCEKGADMPAFVTTYIHSFSLLRSV